MAERQGEIARAYQNKSSPGVRAISAALVTPCAVSIMTPTMVRSLAIAQ
jgi:hypothetical protein